MIFLQLNENNAQIYARNLAHYLKEPSRYFTHDEDLNFLQLFILKIYRLTPSEVISIRGGQHCNEVVDLARQISVFKNNISIDQLDIIHDLTGHSLIQVSNDDESFIIDPYMGYLFEHSNKLLSIEEVVTYQKTHQTIHSILKPIKSNPRDIIYKDFSFVSYGVWGKEVDLNLIIIPKDSRTFRNSHSKLYKGNFYIYGATTFMHKFGAAWSRHWNINMKNTMDHSLLIKFNLSNSIKLTKTPISNIKPVIEGNSVLYQIPPKGLLKLDLSNMVDKSGHSISYDVNEVNISLK